MVKWLFFTLMTWGSLSAFSQNLYFPPTESDEWDTLSPQRYHWCDTKIDSLYEFLEANNTKAFLLLIDGKIVLEQYFNGHDANASWYWASAGKSLTSFMVGLAQQDGYLSIYDATSSYLGNGWTSCSPEQEEKITIRHQLTMTSGLDDGVTDPHCTDVACLTFKANAGERWAYHNAPYTLLNGVIEAATGMSLNVYTNLKVKTVTGMTGLFVPSGYNNVFYSTARSMARYGLLILNNGDWNGRPIMTDQNYFHEMTHQSQDLNQSYGYLWWLNGYDSFMIPQSQFVFPGPLFTNAPTDSYAAMGKNGQFLNVVSGKNMIWIRMGDAPDNSDVPFLLNDQIWGYLNELNCHSVGIAETDFGKNQIRISPIPIQETINITSDEKIVLSELINAQGQIVLRTHPKNWNFEIETSNLLPGFYILRFKTGNGHHHSIKVIKN